MRDPTLSPRLGAMLVVALMLGACGTPSLNQVKQFGDSSASLSTSAVDAFHYIDEADVQRKIYAVAANPKNGPVDATFQGFFDRTGSGALQNNAQRDALGLRLNALKSLASYSKALQVLATSDYWADIDAASKDLNGALVSLGTTYQTATGSSAGLSQADFGLIATAVNAIGKGVVEAKRREAIRTVVKVADPAVQKVAALVSKDLADDSDLARYAQSAVATQRLSMQAAYNAERQMPTSTFDGRLAQLQKIRSAYQAGQDSGALFRNVSQGTKAMAQAHSALLKATEANQFSSDDLAKALAELQAYAQSVQSFRNSLNAAS